MNSSGSWEQRALTLLHQQILFVAVFLVVCQLMLASLSFSSTDLLQVITGLSYLPIACRFHSKACLCQILAAAMRGNPISLAPGDLCQDTFRFSLSLPKVPWSDFLWLVSLNRSSSTLRLRIYIGTGPCKDT